MGSGVGAGKYACACGHRCVRGLVRGATITGHHAASHENTTRSRVLVEDKV